jgi:CheY-like chemotaxis protein
VSSSTTTSDTASPTRAALRIVVVDNDPAVVELVATDLAFEGHDVVATALGGAEALEICRRHRPDVVVVDYRMPPGWNGLQTIERIREELPATTCILYTNYRSAHLSDAAARAGAVYVQKGPLRLLRAALPSLPL